MVLQLEPDILEEVKRILTFWAPGIPVYAYGSRVHGKNLKPTSDLDLVFKGETPTSDRTVQRVKDAFELSDIPMRVDISDWHGMSVEFKEAIAGDLVNVLSSDFAD